MNFTKSTFVILLVCTILISISTIRYLILTMSPNFMGEFGFGFALLFTAFLTIYFIILTIISYKNHKRKEISLSVFIFGVIPAIFIIAIYLWILFDTIIN